MSSGKKVLKELQALLKKKDQELKKLKKVKQTLSSLCKTTKSRGKKKTSTKKSKPKNKKKKSAKKSSKSKKKKTKPDYYKNFSEETLKNFERLQKNVKEYSLHLVKPQGFLYKSKGKNLYIGLDDFNISDFYIFLNKLLLLPIVEKAEFRTDNVIYVKLKNDAK